MELSNILDLHKVFVVLINTTAIWLVIVVLFNKGKGSREKVFIAMAASMLLWINFAYFARVVESARTSVSFLKIAWFGTLPFLFFLFYFAIDLIGKKEKYRRVIYFSFSITVLVTLMTMFTDLVISGVNLGGFNGFGLSIDYGIGMIPFLFNVILLLTTTVYILYKEWDGKSKPEQESLRPFIGGLLTFFILNSVFNVVLPILFGITRYYYFGDYSTLILTSVIAYSIVRHGFMNTKVAVSAFLVSAIGLFLIIDIILLSDSFSEQLLKGIGFILYFVIASLLFKTLREEQEQRDKLASAKEQIENLAREQRDLIDIMGHELRTPLSIIKIKQSLLRKRAKQNPEKFSVENFFEYDKSINEALEREVELLETMLSSTKIDGGKVTVQLERVQLSDVIDASVLGHRSKARNKNLKFVVNKYNKSIQVYADKVKLGEVLDNFVSNAIKYTEKGSVEISAIENGNMVIVSVKDTGMGIPPKSIKRLGEKFFRVQQYINENGDSENGNIVRPGGTGLGLYVTYGLVKMMGGKVKVKSKVGEGSTFSFTIPKYVGQKTRSTKSKRKNVFDRLNLSEEVKKDVNK